MDAIVESFYQVWRASLRAVNGSERGNGLGTTVRGESKSRWSNRVHCTAVVKYVLLNFSKRIYGNALSDPCLFLPKIYHLMPARTAHESPISSSPSLSVLRSPSSSSSSSSPCPSPFPSCVSLPTPRSPAPYWLLKFPPP